MNTKENLINNIVFKLNTYGDFRLEDVDIYDDEEQKGECHKAEWVLLDENKIPCVELENGYVIPIEELSYNELLSITEEIA